MISGRLRLILKTQKTLISTKPAGVVFVADPGDFELGVGDDVVLIFSGPGINDLLEKDRHSTRIQIAELIAVVNQHGRLFTPNLR